MLGFRRPAAARLTPFRRSGQPSSVIGPCSASLFFLPSLPFGTSPARRGDSSFSFPLREDEAGDAEGVVSVPWVVVERCGPVADLDAGVRGESSGCLLSSLRAVRGGDGGSGDTTRVCAMLVNEDW